MFRVDAKTIATAVGSAVITAFVLGAVVLFLRGDDNEPIQLVLPTPEQTVADLGDQGGMPVSESIKVYLSGRVRNPGVYTLKPDDRLSDALAAAGGASENAALDAINLALRVEDEGHYHFPAVGEALKENGATKASDAIGPLGVETGTCGGLIDLNTASLELLETLPGIGPVRATAIASYREEYGDFQALEEVANVSGIGSGTYQNIRDLATVC